MSNVTDADDSLGTLKPMSDAKIPHNGATLSTRLPVSDSKSLPGEQWIPSNADDSDAFMASWCSKCARAGISTEFDDLPIYTCEILTGAFYGKAIEWRSLPTHELICTAFCSLNDPPATPRCERTVDMFSEVGK